MKINNINFSKKIANFIEKSPKTQKILRFSDSNPALFNSICVFGLASILRPSTIILTSDKSQDKRSDALYSAAKSITSGCVDLITSLLIFLPLNKIIDKSTRELFNKKSVSTYFKNKEACSAWKSIANRSAKILMLPIISYFNFKYVRTIVNEMRKYKIENNKHNSNK